MEYRISELDSSTENINREALFEVSQPDGNGGYGSKKYKYEELVALTSKTLFVNADYGNDDTAEPYNYQKPYATLEAAQAAAESGDTIVVQPGEYYIFDPIGVDGVNWYFELGSSVISFSKSFIDDANGSLTFKIRGYLKLEVSIYPKDAIKIEQEGSDIDIEFDSINCTTARSVARVKYGTFRLKGRYIGSLYQYGIEMYDDAKVFVDVEEMYAVATFASYAINLIGQGGTGFNDIRILKLTSNANNVGVLTNTNSATFLNFKGNITHQAATPSNSYVLWAYSSSSINFEGDINTNSKAIYLTPMGGIVSRDSTVKLKNSKVIGTDNDLTFIRWVQSATTSWAANLILLNCEIKAKSHSDSLIVLAGLVRTQFNNVLIVNEDGTAGISIIDAKKLGADDPRLIFNNVGLVSEDLTQKCISNLVGSGIDIQIYSGGLYSNVDKGATVNITVGTLLYDSTIYFNPYI